VRALKLISKAKDLKTIVCTDHPKLELRAVSIPLADSFPVPVRFAIARIAYVEPRVTG